MRKASTSSKESESGLADHPSLCTNAQNVCFTSFQDTDNEQLSTFAADSDCSDEREINPALVNEEAMCETCISSRSNSHVALSVTFQVEPESTRTPSSLTPQSSMSTVGICLPLDCKVKAKSSS